MCLLLELQRFISAAGVASERALKVKTDGQNYVAGKIELTFPVVTQGSFTRSEDYENIILRASQDGSAIVRLKDVAHLQGRPEAVYC